MKLRSLIFMSLVMFAINAQAELNGKNVVLVHGLKVADFKNNPSDDELPALAADYWSEYWGSRAEATLYWPATERITGRVKDLIRAQIEELEESRLCQDGCVFVTHSAGDLVTRHALTSLGQWQIDPSKFKVLLTLDFAGAGGGSELADIAVNISEGSGIINAAQRAAIDAFLGIDPSPGSLGTVYDLRPAVARNIGTQNTAVPRLRFVGSGSAYLGITKPFVRGNDDSVVGYHSTCGARFASSYESCSRSVRDNGVLRSSDGPSSFMSNHYPILMGEKADHFDVITNNRTGNYTTVINDQTIGGLQVDFSTETKRKWWALWRKVRQVKDGDRKSMSANVYDTLSR